MTSVMDFDYEFRHPGHGDQSVHNPHKGGGVPAGFVRPKATDPYFANKGDHLKDVSDEEFVAVARSNGLDPQTLEVDTFTERDRLSPSELAAVESYTDGTYALQSAVLGKPVHPDAVTEAATLRGVLESRSLESDATLHRGMGNGMLGRLTEAGVGGTVKTDRFVSAAASRDGVASFGDAVLVIDAPKGTKGAWIDRLMMANDPGRAKSRSDTAKSVGSPFYGESEFVFPPGITFKIESIGTTQRRVFGTSSYKTVPLVTVSVKP